MSGVQLINFTCGHGSPPSVDNDQGSPTFWHQGPVSEKTIFPWTLGEEGLEMVQVTMGVMGSSGEPQIKLHSLSGC